jgi:hypothetical protein
MSKKTMLVSLAAVSAAMFALPATASAQEIHWITLGGSSFLTLTTESEPNITCESSHSTTTSSSGGTTGSIEIDATGCHTTVFGITVKCHTTGSPADNTLTAKGTFHLTTVGSAPAMLITTEPMVAICAGISNMTFQGNVIGTLISPACGEPSDTLATTFSATGSTQNDLEYTGAKYDLTGTTSGGIAKTAGLTTTVTIEHTRVGKLECT